MRTIRKKTWKKYFESLLSGEKTFDLRLADFTCDVGDVLVFEEYDPDKKEYTGRRLEKKITYVLKTRDQPFFKKEDVERYGFVIMGISNKE